MENTSNNTSITPIPRVFIGSSSKGKKIAQVVKELIEIKDKDNNKKIDAVVWDKMFKIGQTYIERLSKALDEFDFAVLVITGEDLVVGDKTQHGEKKVDKTKLFRARDNVLFELGLFMGRLGRHRAIMLYNEKKKAQLPSDLGGIHTATFSMSKKEEQDDKTRRKVLKPPCKEIREYILDPYEEEIKVFEVWKDSCRQLYEALEKAPEHATIRIIQTWFPDIEDFIIHLVKLLTAKNGKQFRLEILLMNNKKYSNEEQTECLDILDARVSHRIENRERAIGEIDESIKQLIKLKELVDENWEINKVGKTLDLIIRKYHFLPFGPFYQIGDEVMFVGFYLNYCSSIHAPMIKIRRIAREAWNRFKEHFDIGWEKSYEVYSSDKKNKKIVIINNKNELSSPTLRVKALNIVEAGIFRVLPSTVMKHTIKIDHAKKILTIKDKNKDFHYDFSKGRIFVIGGGKASGLMAQTLEEIIGAWNITGGVVNCNSKNYQTGKIQIVEASHPIPDQRGVSGVEQMLVLKDRYSINKNDLVICLISGGGSALMPSPVDEITLKDKQEMTKLLIKRGPAIQEINAVRKHLSKTKGGQLGKFFSPAQVITLIISDVIGNDLDAIASGPTVPDSSTFSDAYNVLEKYKLLNETPKSIVDFIEKGCAGEIEETPKKLDNCRNIIIGDNRLALEAMASEAKKLGFKPHIVTAEQKGDPTAMAKLRADEILNSKYTNYNVILIGGETTPKLPPKHGKGGRNQHYAAVSMVALQDYPGEWAMTSVGTDGSDFIKNIAGAIVDANTLKTAKSKKIKIQPYLDRYDSSTLLERIGNSLIETGNTGTNVCDVMVYILKQ
ncbi:MAG: DUF4147 domain-containing protein [Candidatus Aminicenantes bacterium]|nr:DUF4147 domain-containing protein [Candidatus Aminicenantes bacterium]